MPELKAFACKFVRRHRIEEWVRFATDRDTAERLVIRALEQEFPDGHYGLLSVEPTSDPRL